MFDLVVMVDWSASSTPGPKTPKADQIWCAAGTRSARIRPVYFRTRAECIEGLLGLLASRRVRTLLGFDFPFGYPPTESGEALLPAGRELCADLARRLGEDVQDTRSPARFQRFRVAGDLNREIKGTTGRAGPFWGHPSSHARRYPGLGPRKPGRTRVNECRAAELAARASARGRGGRGAAKSAWQMTGAGSVGSQAITGLAAVNRLVADPAVGPRCRLWPFETGWDANLGPDDSVVIAEIYPTLAEGRCERFEIKDANQVAGQRDLVLEHSDPASLLARPAGLDNEAAERALAHEGWILGLGAGQPA